MPDQAGHGPLRVRGAELPLIIGDGVHPLADPLPIGIDRSLTVDLQGFRIRAPEGWALLPRRASALDLTLYP
jgi:hypothetical protein